jgi:integrase
MSRRARVRPARRVLGGLDGGARPGRARTHRADDRPGRGTPPDSTRDDAAPGEPPSFQLFASEWLERKRRRVDRKTHKELLWRLSTGTDHFGRHRADRIDEIVIEDFVQAMLAERGAIRAAAAAGRPLVQTITRPDGRTYERRRRPLPNVTPHTLRRTFASILAECGVAPRRAMYLLGHTDAKLTLSDRPARRCRRAPSRPRRRRAMSRAHRHAA